MKSNSIFWEVYHLIATHVVLPIAAVYVASVILRMILQLFNVL